MVSVKARETWNTSEPIDGMHLEILELVFQGVILSPLGKGPGYISFTQRQFGYCYSLNQVPLANC